MPFGSEIRWWRRVPQWVSVLIRQGKGTSSIRREPIEQKFLSAGTLDSQSVLQHSRSTERLERPEGIEAESRLPVLFGSRDVEDQGTTDLRACRIDILKTHEEMCQGVLFFLGTAVTVSDKCCTHLVE